MTVIVESFVVYLDVLLLQSCTVRTLIYIQNYVTQKQQMLTVVLFNGLVTVNPSARRESAVLFITRSLKG